MSEWDRKYNGHKGAIEIFWGADMTSMTQVLLVSDRSPVQVEQVHQVYQVCVSPITPV